MIFFLVFLTSIINPHGFFFIIYCYCCCSSAVVENHVLFGLTIYVAEHSLESAWQNKDSQSFQHMCQRVLCQHTRRRRRSSRKSFLIKINGSRWRLLTTHRKMQPPMSTNQEQLLRVVLPKKQTEGIEECHFRVERTYRKAAFPSS